jgi:MFS family permease
MYQIEASSALRVAGARPFRFVRLSVSSNVIALGVTSLLTDVSSEMVSTVLPVYLVLHLGLTPLQFGVIDGIYHGVTALVRVVSGFAADRWQRHKEIAAAGYGLSAVCKVGIAAAGTAWPLLATVVAADRIGKGVRTAPRDALISLSTPAANHGLAFGVHRAFDSAGAMFGPLVALLILAMLPERFDVVFVASSSVALLGLGVLLTYVRNVSPHMATGAYATAPKPSVSWADVQRLAPLLGAAALLSLSTVSDAFLYLLLQQQTGFNSGLFPLLYVGTALSYLVLAIPAGRIADRIGRRRMLLLGHGVMCSAYLLTFYAGSVWLPVVGCVVLLGAHYATTDGVLMAVASNICSPAHRASGLALVSTVTSAGRFVAALAFGALWTWYDSATAVWLFSAALAAAVSVSAGIFALEKRRQDDDVCEA